MTAKYPGPMVAGSELLTCPLSRRGVFAVAALLVAGCSSRSSGVATAPSGVTSGASGSTNPTSSSHTTWVRVTGAPNVAGARTHTVELDGLAREFIVYTPEGAAGDIAAPVVFMLHGTSGDGQRFFDGSGWRELADREGFIAVFPSSLTLCWLEDVNHDGDILDRDDINVRTRWNAGQDSSEEPLCTAQQTAALPAPTRAKLDHPLPDDVEFVRRMLAVLSSEYSVDRARIYVSGFSNGGQMASRLMVDLDEEFAAIAVAAGNLGLLAEPASHPLPLVFSVGSVDDRFLAAAGVSELPLDEAIFDLPLMAKIRDDFLTVGQLANEYTVAEVKSSLGRVVTFRFATSLVGADNAFHFVVMEGVAHDYPRALPTALWTVFQSAHL